MTIKEAIDRADDLKPNQFSEELKLAWLNNLDAQIHDDIIKTHEGWDGEEFRPYENDTETLIVPFPYEELYVAFLKMKVDDENGDTQRYQNSVTMFNAQYDAWTKAYNKAHMPIGMKHFRLY